MKDEKPDQHLLIPFLIGARQGFLLGCWLVSGLWGILLHLNVLGLTLIFWWDTVRVTCECHKTNEKFHLDVQTRTQTIIVGNCQKYYFCRDKSFVVRNTCLSWQNTSFVRIKVCLLWQNFCCDKQFIAMKLCLLWQKFCNAKLTFATTNTFLSWQNTYFVVTKVCLLRQNNFFVMASILLLWQKMCFVMANMSLSQQQNCCDKHGFVTTKITLVAAPTNDNRWTKQFQSTPTNDNRWTKQFQSTPTNDNRWTKQFQSTPTNDNRWTKQFQSTPTNDKRWTKQFQSTPTNDNRWTKQFQSTPTNDNRWTKQFQSTPTNDNRWTKQFQSTPTNDNRWTKQFQSTPTNDNRWTKQFQSTPTNDNRWTKQFQSTPVTSLWWMYYAKARRNLCRPTEGQLFHLAHICGDWEEDLTHISTVYDDTKSLLVCPWQCLLWIRPPSFVFRYIWPQPPYHPIHTHKREEKSSYTIA